MSTTIHVGKSKVWTITEAGGKPIDPSYTYGWSCSKDGGNIVMNGNKNTCTIECTGVGEQGDYTPGQPVLLTCNITSHDGQTTPVNTQINLVAADTPEQQVPLAGSGTPVMVGGTWGSEK